jgi:hypothetical protein
MEQKIYALDIVNGDNARTRLPQSLIRRLFTKLLRFETALKQSNLSGTRRDSAPAGGGFAKTNPNVIARSEATKQSHSSPLKT